MRSHCAWLLMAAPVYQAGPCWPGTATSNHKHASDQPSRPTTECAHLRGTASHRRRKRRSNIATFHSTQHAPGTGPRSARPRAGGRGGGRRRRGAAHRRLQRGEVLQQQPGAVLRVARRELAEARQHGIVDGRNDAADRLDRLARESLAPRDLLLHNSGTRCVLPRLLVLQRAGYREARNAWAITRCVPTASHGISRLIHTSLAAHMGSGGHTDHPIDDREPGQRNAT